MIIDESRGYRKGQRLTRVVVIGAGIVGSAIAAELSATHGYAITVIDQGPAARLAGSTGHAPGYVGKLGDSPVLTELARASASAYDPLEHDGEPGFRRVGAIEVAFTDAAARVLERRARMAHEAELPAHLIDPSEAASLAPALVDRGRCLCALHFPEDGTAHASLITAALRAAGERRGVRYVSDQAVIGFDTEGDRVRSVRTATVIWPADRIVIAAGIWSPVITSMLGFRLPLTPVAHPYIYGAPHPAAPAFATTPFVRWPEHRVYARDHGDRFGLGTYDHEPLPIASDALGACAEREWPGPIFDRAIDRGLMLLPMHNRLPVEQRLNGVFAMTPDNMPFLGAVPGVDGVWLAAAIWVTHAAGAAQALVDLMLDREPAIPGIETLTPDRFSGEPDHDLERRALALYRDIYSTA